MRLRSRARHAVAVVVAMMSALLLAGCTGLPTSGAVVAGAPIDEEAGSVDFSFLPDDPPPGATPQQIVAGFLAAGSGPRDDWGTARQFLAPDFRSSWQPTARATVDLPGERVYTVAGDGTVTVSITAEASVDATGALSVADGGSMPLAFSLVDVDGEWRISDAPDGVVLDRARFQAVFREYSVMYFDRSWSYLVPDRRWFPATNAATHIAEALIDGDPSPWLSGAVYSAFPESLELATRAVPLDSGVAQVPLSQSALAIVPETRNRMQAQLEASLQSAGIREAQMSVDGEPVAAQAVDVRPTRVDVRPLVLTDDAFGFLSGSEIEPVPGLSEAIADLEAEAIQVGADRRAAAVRTTSGAVVRARDDATFEVVDERAGLVDPTIDPQGFIWTVPGGSPSALLATGADGTVVPIADAWPGASQISSIEVSRDGTRIAALVRDGSRPALWIAGVLRDDSGAPVGLGDRETIAQLPGTGLAASWVDASTIAVLAEDGDGDVVISQSVGGFGEFTTAPAGAVSIAATNQLRAVRVLDGDGVLYAQKGQAWPPAAEGIRVLAGQQGSPR
ncbi:LpqB family beta-propeller domain-containing protein [Microbacterium sp. cf332]|uniref:LpqB family beta-propeller domain-containing protein n=1 Tax=Microbacterium sp. cf332 TaxID=1761804 RepID=UPI00087E71BC|nr:LpqB family beta-propeller domain-containing protein [Microbacterium sp. cf332]SDQ80326.1 Lipoprotein LpqB beta-propeller domain-containing protein [Microbacterium sp. cf332]